MGMVVIEHGRSRLLAHLIKRICRDVVDIHKVHARLFHHLTVPASVRVVAAFHLSFRPFVAWREAQQNWSGAFLTGILNKLLQVPSERIDHLVASIALHLIDMACVGCCGDYSALLWFVDATNVVVAELQQHIVAWFQRIVNLIPASFSKEGSGGASCFRTVHERAFLSIEHSGGLRAPSPHAVRVFICILSRGVAGEEYPWFFLCDILLCFCHHPVGVRLQNRLRMHHILDKAGLQSCNLRIGAGVKSLCKAGCVHPRAKCR